MASIEIRKNSWLNFSDLLDFFGTQGTSGVVESEETIAFWSLPEFPQVIPQDNDVFFNITDEHLGRLDLLAYDAYGDPDLWWVIALANNYEILPTDMILGSRIRIPNKAYVDSLIGRGQQK